MEKIIKTKASEYGKRYYLKHKKEHQMGMKSYRKRNKAKIKRYNKKYCYENRDRINKYGKNYHNLMNFGGLRESVFERDSWSCVECGMTNEQHIIIFGRQITIHHIDGKGRYSKKPNNSLDNMQTEESVNAGGGGCSSCGYGGEGSWRFWLGLKCLDCGNAKVIFKGDSN